MLLNVLHLQMPEAGNPIPEPNVHPRPVLFHAGRCADFLDLARMPMLAFETTPEKLESSSMLLDVLHLWSTK